MFAFRPRNRFLCTVTLALIGAGVQPASAQTVLFYEDFSDATIVSTARVTRGVVANGIATFTDDLTTNRATFSDVQTFDSPAGNPNAQVMTFQFDMVGAVVPVGPRENGSPLSGRRRHKSKHVEQHGVRGGSRYLFRQNPLANFSNNGMESVFLVFNNKATDLTFNSPVDGASVTLAPWNYVPYILDRGTNIFVQLKAPTHSNAEVDEPARTITKFGIGSATNTDIGSFAIDNVLVRSGAVFNRNFPAPTLVGNFDNSNNTVDGADLTLFRQRFGNTAAPLADADNDGDTDGNDFLLWQRNVGNSIPVVAAGGAVPEPSTLVLVALSAAAALSGGRRRAARI